MRMDRSGWVFQDAFRLGNPRQLLVRDEPEHLAGIRLHLQDFLGILHKFVIHRMVLEPRTLFFRFCERIQSIPGILESCLASDNLNMSLSYLMV